MLRVGLTGGIACGKSHVLRRLEAHGFGSLDLDRIAHSVMAPGGPAYDEVVAEFGQAVLGRDGAIDRKALGAQVFTDPERLLRLNAIVHPRVRQEEQRRVAALASDGRAVVVTDAALLVEAGVHLRFDRLVVVHCREQEQLRRLMARDALPREQAEARIGAQLPLAQKRRFAHLEVDTSGELEETDAAADALAGRLGKLAQAPAPPLRLSRELLLALAAGADEPPLPERLFEDIAAHGGLEMPRVAALLGRPAQGSWLAAGAPPGTRVSPSLAAPVVAWCLARRGGDDELLGLASMSLARAVTSDASAVAGACGAAFLMARFAEDPGAPQDRAGAVAFAERWAGAAPAGVGWAPADARGSQVRPALLAAIDRFLERG